MALTPDEQALIDQLRVVRQKRTRRDNKLALATAAELDAQAAQQDLDIEQETLRKMAAS